MTFLNPSILFGLFAAAIPILLHFLNLRKLKTIEFSTLLFLKELQKTKIKRIKLKQLLLLIIRIIIIVFIVLAFARPTLKNSFSNETAKTSAIFIIDNTFSMSLVNEKGSLLNQAKLKAKNLINEIKDGDEVTIITIGEVNTKKFIPTKSIKELINQIDNIEISEVSNTLNQAMVEASKIIYESNQLNKEIYIFTDMQKSRLINSKDELSDYGKIFPENTRLFLIDLSNDEYNNLGIVSFQSENQIFELNKDISFTVKVKNYSNSKIDNNVISLFINGKRSSQKNLTLNSNEMKEVILETTLKDTGLVNFSAELEDDAILNDNQFFLSVNVKKNVSVLICTENPNSSKFVNYAISLNPNIKLKEINFSQLNSVDLNNYDLIMLFASANNHSLKKVNEFLLQGKNLVVFPSENSNSITYSQTLKQLNLNYQFIEKGNVNSNQIVNEFGKIDFNHSLFKNIFTEEKKTKIESAEINKFLQTQLTGKEKPIIQLANGSPFLFEINELKSKILVFTSSPTLGWNDFPLKSLFAPLINKIVYYASIKLKDENYITGNELNVDISKTNLSLIKVAKPVNIVEYIKKDSLQNQNVMTYKNTNKKGVYKFFSNDKLLDYFDVNIDPRESEQEKFSIEDFKEYLKTINFRGKIYDIKQDDSLSKVIYDSRFGTELWKYFLMVALILLILESLIARNTKKDLANFNR
ncbi:MAG: BatA and WFA domain-containing protein [Stygiobacter sp.]